MLWSPPQPPESRLLKAGDKARCAGRAAKIDGGTVRLSEPAKRLLAGPIFAAVLFASWTIGLVVWHGERKLARRSRD